ncbi:hypothetical protein E4T56_gene13203 [Termitomyces sp. T112]|nr:hypothetical protein E4T56_gene13203 [Termitomyces sp. T112]
MSYAPCLRHGPVALASSQTQPHFVQLGPRYSTQCFIPDPTSLRSVFVFLTQCFIPDPTSLCSVRSLYF